MKKILTIAAVTGLLTQFVTTSAFAVLPIEGKDNSPMPTGIPKPAKNAPFTDPVYGTSITRVTSAALDNVTPWATNIYSRSQAFNCNNTKMLMFSVTNGVWSLYNATPPYNKIKTMVAPSLGGGNAEPQWDPINPDVFYYFNENGTDKKLHSVNVVTGAYSVAGDFNNRLPWPTAYAVSTKAEGSPSADGRYWAFVVDNTSWQRIGYFTWDKQTDTILGTLTSTTANGFGAANHVSMSPSGNNVVISVYGGPGAVQFNRTFTQIRQLAPVGEHSDIALLPNGNDAFVSVNYANGDVFFTDMGTGVRTVLYNIFANGGNSAIHFSGKAYNKPGWAVISTFLKAGPLRWDHNKVFAIELKANPRIYCLAHNHFAPPANGQYYWAAPKATTNRDLTKVLFTSNWEVPSDTAVDSYMINLQSSDIPSSAQPTNIIVDNPSVAAGDIVGAWTSSSALATRYGTNYIHDGNTGKGAKSVTFRPTLPTAGTYQVYLWWPADTNRADNVPVDILHQGGTSTVTVNQKLSGGQWNLIGSYSFSAGTTGTVKVRTTGTNGFVMADAVRFTK